MFLGKPELQDTIHTNTVFDKLTTQQLSYFWRPEEVSLQKDRGDYQTLRPEQKHIYTSNLDIRLCDSIKDVVLEWHSILLSSELEAYGSLGLEMINDRCIPM